MSNRLHRPKAEVSYPPSSLSPSAWVPHANSWIVTFTMAICGWLAPIVALNEPSTMKE
jgi:hypothetical protein